MENTANTALYNLLVTHNFDPKATKNGDDPINDQGKKDISVANMFSFDYKTSNKNYGTVVIMLGDKNNMIVFYGDNVGRAMEGTDKQEWYQFLEQLKNFAMRNMLRFELDNINRLKYTMQGMAAIKEGLFEGYYGKKNISYSDQPKQVRLMIKHNRNILEGEPRYRAIESLFVETADGERFRVPSRSLAHGRMIARHVAEGGNPYDAFGNHINEIVTELATLSRFIRAAKHKPFTGEAAGLVEAAVRHYGELKAKAKHMISQRGYHEARDSFDPAEITDSSEMAESIRNMFIEQTLDSRIEEALPILAKLKETPMREADEFESWTNQVMEGTWALPDTPDAERQLADLMSKPLIVGADATNATEQLYDLIGDDILFDRLGDLAERDPNANCWEDPGVINRLGELGIDINPTVGPESDQEVDESALQAYLGNKKYGKDGMDALRKAGREHAGKEKMASIRAKYDKLDEEDIAEGFGSNYAEQLAQKLFNQHPDLEKEDDILKAAYAIAKQELGARANGIFRDEDFPGDLISAYNWVKEEDDYYGLPNRDGSNEGVEEDLDTDGVMMTKPSNMSSESVDPVLRLKQMIKH